MFGFLCIPNSNFFNQKFCKNFSIFSFIIQKKQRAGAGGDENLKINFMWPKNHIRPQTMGDPSIYITENSRYTLSIYPITIISCWLLGIYFWRNIFIFCLIFFFFFIRIEWLSWFWWYYWHTGTLWFVSLQETS